MQNKHIEDIVEIVCIGNLCEHCPFDESINGKGCDKWCEIEEDIVVKHIKHLYELNPRMFHEKIFKIYKRLKRIGQLPLYEKIFGMVEYV